MESHFLTWLIVFIRLQHHCQMLPNARELECDIFALCSKRENKIISLLRDKLLKHKTISESVYKEILSTGSTPGSYCMVCLYAPSLFVSFGVLAAMLRTMEKHLAI